MKIVQINTFSNKSTGTIMMNIHKKLLSEGYDSYVVWGRGRKAENSYEIYLNDKLGVYYHGLYTRLTDKTGFVSKKATLKLLKRLDEIKPDIIHLHNIHGYYINIEMLFNYIKKNDIKVVWTLHDCWSFTGHCPHFEHIKCEKWIINCNNCPQKNTYPKSFTDNSKLNYLKKEKLFTGINNLIIVTPSKWLANLVKKSYLKEYPVITINNGINTNIFRKKNSNFKKKNNLENKKIILGVSSDWTEQKGFNDFLKLSNIISDDYKIVMVGLNSSQLKKIPSNILGIKKTSNVEELVDIYNAADIYFNPTYADTYPTTNLEALACGTPVCTYSTGGSPECINNKNGVVIAKGAYLEFANNIDKITKIKKNLSILSKDFDESNMLDKYLKVYNGDII